MIIIRCMKVGCKEVNAIPNDSLSNKALLSNKYRHLKLCLLGIGRKGNETGTKNVIKPPKFMKTPFVGFLCEEKKLSISRPPPKNVTIVDGEIEFAMTSTRPVSDSLTIAASSTMSTTNVSVPEILGQQATGVDYSSNSSQPNNNK